MWMSLDRPRFGWRDFGFGFTAENVQIRKIAMMAIG
jgi:hypothetical protein